MGSGSGSNGTVAVSGGNWNSSSLFVAYSGTGSLTITNGTVSSSSGMVGYLAGSNGTVNVSGGNWTNSGILRIGNSGNGNLTISGGTVSNTSGTVGSSASGNGMVNVSGGNWANSGNLTIGSAGNGTLNLTGIGTVSVGGGLVTLANTSGKTGTLNLGNGTTAGTLSAATITGGNGTAVVNINQSGSYSLGSNMTGSLALRHTGTGTTTLTGTNTYAGATTISAGTLQVGDGGTAGSLASNVTNNAALAFNRSDNSTYSGVISGTGAVTKLGGGALTLNGSNTYTGATTISAGTLQVATGGSITGGALYIGKTTGDNGTLNLTGGSIDHYGQNDYVGSESSGATGVGTVNVSAGTWINNSFEIGTYGAGTLNLSGTGNITSADCYLGYEGTGNGTANVSGGSWTVSGLDIGEFGTGTLNLTGGNVTVTGAVGWGSYLGWSTGGLGTANVSGGTWATNRELLLGGDGGTGILNISGTGLVTNTEGYLGGYSESSRMGDGIANISGGTWTNSGNLTVGLGGNGTLNLTDNGTVTAGGILKLASDAGSTGTLNLGNGTTAGTLSAATITGGNGTAVVNINQSSSYSLGSNMTGSLSLNHIGTGTTTITGANTYSGNTTVSAGTLNVNGSTSASSRFTVASGATLGGNGTIGGATMIYGIHSPGNSPGIQTFSGNLTYDTSGGNGPTVNWQLSGNTDTDFSAFDQIVVGGNLAFNTPTSLVLDFSGYGDVDWADPFWTTDQSWVIYDVAGTTTGANNFSIATANWADNSGDTFNTLLSGSAFSLGQQGNDLVLSYTAATAAVPEPSQVAASLLALVGLGIYLWRKKHTAQASRLRS